MLLAAGVLTGCASPRPEPPAAAAVELPPAWTMPVPAGSAGLADWWRRFGDDDLVRWVEAARQANTDVVTAGARLRQARALARAADALQGPTLGLSGSAQRVRPAAAAQPSNLFQAGVDAAWEVDLWGEAARGAAAAQADAAAAQASLEAARVAVAAEMAQLVVQWRGTQWRAAFARDNLQAQQQTLQIVRWRRQAGLAGAVEEAQATAAVEQTRAQLPQLAASEAQTRHAIAVLAGLVPQQAPAALPPDRSPPALPQPPGDLAVALPASVLRQRADLAAAEAQMLAAAERVAQADAARRPSLALRASTAWSALTLSSLGGTSAASALVASLSATVFDGGRRDAQLDAQQAAFEQAAQAYRARVLLALQEVQDALAQLDGAQRRVQALAAAEQAASAAATLAAQRHAAGLIDFQTVLETQRTRLSAQDAWTTARTDVVAAHVRLYKALGGGWEPAAGHGAPR